MDGLTAHGEHARELQCQADELSSACLALIATLEDQAVHLRRADQVAQLKQLKLRIEWQWAQVENSESEAEYRRDKRDLALSAGGFALSIIGVATKNKNSLKVANGLFDYLESQHVPFGTTMVTVGPLGLPDDVNVISISRLARHSGLQDTEVVSQLRGQGRLLFSKQDFSRLVDKLTYVVEAGELNLPVSVASLPQVLASGDQHQQEEES